MAQNVASLGFDLKDLIARKKIVVDYVYVERSESEESGEYDLEGLSIRLGQAIDSVGARRVVLDAVEALFAGLPNQAILRAELRRLFRWLKEKGVTAIITGESRDGMLTRQGLEEYVSDCVIVLDHRVSEQTSSRRLRVVKYRGSTHGTNEYPFLIDKDGISVLPVTSLSLEHSVSTERVSTGIPRLDAMLGGKDYYRGSSVLVSGTAGTGKSSIAAHFSTAGSCHRQHYRDGGALRSRTRVNLASGKLTGAEALIRWSDPRTGLVPPGRFIPILEETGLIYEVGRWALRQAIADYLRWRAAGLPAVRIAVNVSALQLRNRGFIEEIRRAIGIDAQAPAGLELEITESLIMADVMAPKPACGRSATWA